MGYTLLYTQRALADLAEIIGYIAEDHSEAAIRFGHSLLDHIELLRSWPRIGTAVHERPQVRKLVHSPIVIYYQLDEGKDLIEVLHFRHGARNAPEF